MSTSHVRHNVHVINFYNHSEGASINYIFNGCKKILVIDKDNLYEQLLDLSSIDDREQYDDYSISQYDALMLSIRHEHSLIFDSMVKSTDVKPAIG